MVEEAIGSVSVVIDQGQDQETLVHQGEEEAEEEDLTLGAIQALIEEEAEEEDLPGEVSPQEEDVLTEVLPTDQEVEEILETAEM